MYTKLQKPATLIIINVDVFWNTVHNDSSSG